MLIERLSKSKDGHSADHFCAKANALNEQIESLTSNLRKLKIRCFELEEFIRQVDELNRRSKQVDQYVTRIAKLYCDWVTVSRNDVIEQQLDRTSRRLVELQDQLNNYKRTFWSRRRSDQDSWRATYKNGSVQNCYAIRCRQ